MGQPEGRYDARYDAIEVGQQLGHLEYVVTGEMLRRFREAVEYPEAGFPSIAVQEYAEVLNRKYGYISLTSVGHEDFYYTPPRLNKRIQVTGWVREKYQRQGRCWLVVETMAVDEDGTEVVRSKHTFVVDDMIDSVKGGE